MDNVRIKVPKTCSECPCCYDSCSCMLMPDDRNGVRYIWDYDSDVKQEWCPLVGILVREG